MTATYTMNVVRIGAWGIEAEETPRDAREAIRLGATSLPRLAPCSSTRAITRRASATSWANEGAGGLALVQEVLQEAMNDGAIQRLPVVELANMILAALEEASLLVAQATDKARAKRSVGLILDRLLFSLTPAAGDLAAGVR